MPPVSASDHLRRLLFLADVLAGVISGALVGVVARGSGGQVLLLAVVVAVAWPVVAFLCGLYAREDLRAWSSGVSEAPRLVLTCLACRGRCTRCSSRWASPGP